MLLAQKLIKIPRVPIDLYYIASANICYYIICKV